ncbi:sugar phosphate isomerase/epimerase family protein [Gandjariella thermophila]|uniref:Inosose dehydratase n=1 Tax=Gandjariella thermophila TaxID=1931992 RepID=A0A4D4JE75_9PSEU|nr:sugar phosphate isomerase/epimerase [Gandjariella thermophila]GDY32153.1 inosose dehydratase [Gandjariella thermophila]
MTVKIAAAPISWGVCEVPGWGRVLPPATVLGEMADLGLAATELGPPGYLPTRPADLKGLLAGHDLDLVGGFLAVVLHDAAAAESTVDAAERSAALLASAGAEVLVLAAATGLDGYDERPTLGVAQWRRLVDTAARVRDVAARHGLRTVLHPHVGTHVERTGEVERFLADSDLPLCLDTGHLLIGGTDPVQLARRHPDRIGHLHLKDVRADLAEAVRTGRLGYAEAVRRGIYVPLGDGDVDVESMVRFVHGAGYRGWYVLEQDTALGEADPVDLPARHTARSLDHLDRIIGRLPAGGRP